MARQKKTPIPRLKNTLKKIAEEVAAGNKNDPTSLELIYGKRGVPENDNVKAMFDQPLPLPPALLPAPKKDESCPIITVDTKPLGAPMPAGKHRVTLHRDVIRNVPSLFFGVFIASNDPTERAQFATMFARAWCYEAKSLNEADLVVFTGGTDVDPELYGETMHKDTDFPDKDRDDDEIWLFNYCLEEGIPMLGICRGAQFLHVMNHGKLFQHVDNHYGPHSMWDRFRKVKVERISSSHHQLVKPNAGHGMQILGASNVSRIREANNTDKFSGPTQDIEAFFYRETCCLGIQGHPEYAGYPAFMHWSIQTIEDQIVNNPDLEYTNDRTKRMKKELRDQRKFSLPEPVQKRLKATLEKLAKEPEGKEKNK